MPVNTMFIEEGSAFMAIAGAGLKGRLAGETPSETAATGEAAVERFKVIVIGGGQAGLSAGYHLSRCGIPFVILDAGARIGDPWRNRWDSLRLFTPARYDGLSGLPFPGARSGFPDKDAMADYLEAYAARFRLPVRPGTKVDRVFRDGGRYVVTAGDRRFEADAVIVAMSNYQEPRVPDFARDLDPAILQVHSSAYRNPRSVRDGRVLVVGAGNSGADVALDLARTHEVVLAGRHPGHLPFRIESFAARHVLVRVILGGVFHRVLTVNTPMGRKARAQVKKQGGPLIRVKPRDLDRAGVERTGRVAGVRDGRPMLADGLVLEVGSIVWATGYQPGFAWIDLPVFGEDGYPRHEYGRATDVDGLYFLGLPFIYSFSSVMVHGVGRDAERVAGMIAARAAA